MASNLPTLSAFLDSLDKRMIVRVTDLETFDDWEASVADINAGLPNLMRRKLKGSKVMMGVLNIYV